MFLLFFVLTTLRKKEKDYFSHLFFSLVFLLLLFPLSSFTLTFILKAKLLKIIEMQYKPETEKVAMMGNSYMPVLRPISLAEDHEVQRTRKIFMIIMGVFLVSFLFTIEF